MEVAKLCTSCSQIEFSALATPTLADIHRAQRDIRRGIGFWPRVLPDGTWKGPGEPPVVRKVNLGSFERIERDSEHCELCAVIVDVVRQQGGYYAPNNALPTGDEVHFWADPTSHYGHITDSAEDIESSWNEAYFKMRRLAITASRSDTEVSLAYFDHVVQPCRVGASKVLDIKQQPPAEDDMLFLGRMRPPTLNMDLPRRWVEFTFRIRFIDVNNMCIRLVDEFDPSDPSMAYTALSYVWGQKQKLMLSAEIEPRLKENGSIRDDDLPKTVSDAITVTRLLGLSFLWVDAVCIMQGKTKVDLDDRAEQIGNMANIYRSAFLTIVDAFGEDADAGLAGLRPGTRSYQQREVVVIPPSPEKGSDGLSLLTTCKAFPKYFGEFFNRRDEDADISTWNTRGWTLQERALSRRNLIFTREQVLWACDGAYFCEESSFEHPIPPAGSSELRTPIRFELFKGLQLNATNLRSLDGKMARIASSSKKFWDKYRLLVQHFSMRKLSFPGDVHDAFLGIMMAMQRVRDESFHWGHPRSRFELSLSWSSFHTPTRRAAKSTLPMTSLKTNIVFPTWSWMGWEGEANVSVSDERLETEYPVISCFIHKSDPLRLEMINGTQVNESVLKPSTPYRNIPWLDDNHIRREVTLEHVSRHLPTVADVLQARTLPDEHLIFFWASTAHFDVPLNPEEKHERATFAEYAAAKRPSIRDASGLEVGHGTFMSADVWKEFSDSGGRAEFVAVARRQILDLDLPAIVIALQIRWVDGKARRVNYAEIEEAAWMEAGPEWKLIALQ
ncbi:hypothetical protein M406DRAFT_73671 [Cryphonectria parasitica EP155]|uniref:Heterokaryon incompatibility domain-containing protein n=1 Tax=Cryphonectria parasitica (strain ATCC 38755 / EP155) TaxID=660469 RepID=A0A9P4XY41_CRYP1|nr:uncharacterized protein M406DRAFT_73671 [Cryphonectria parasitica EP155]KAF3763016.1 hypothetical protein M406DRAFT_73671 [Cryphonectria parasitica EP155]